MRIGEKMLILPALYIIKRQGSATTSDLQRELDIFFNPSGEDAEILAGRNDSKFSQIVRNLVSHRSNNSMAEYTDFEDGVYTLTLSGEEYLETRTEELDYLFSQKFRYDDIVKAANELSDEKKAILVYDEDTLISEGKAGLKITKKRERSKKLREAAIAFYSKQGRLRCTVCGFDFEDVYGQLGKGFIEIHHEEPIYRHDESGSTDFISEAVKKVKPVCANCHRMIHRNPKEPLTISELKGYMK